MSKIYLFVLSLSLTITIQAMEHPTTSTATLIKSIQAKIAEIRNINARIKANFETILAHQKIQNEALASLPQNPDQELTNALLTYNSDLIAFIDTTKQLVHINQINVTSLIQQLSNLIQHPLVTSTIPSINPVNITPTFLESQHKLLENFLNQLTELQLVPTEYKTINLLILQIEYYAAITYNVALSILNNWITRQNNIAIQIIEKI